MAHYVLTKFHQTAEKLPSTFAFQFRVRDRQQKYGSALDMWEIKKIVVSSFMELLLFIRFLWLAEKKSSSHCEETERWNLNGKFLYDGCNEHWILLALNENKCFNSGHEGSDSVALFCLHL